MRKREQETVSSIDEVEEPSGAVASQEDVREQADAEDRGPTPGDVLRTLPSEAQQRGTRFISAQAMQAKLFSVYDAAAAAEDALALVQQQLTLTLNRSYYDADEVESMASQLDALLALETLDMELVELDELDAVEDLDEKHLVSED